MPKRKKLMTKEEGNREINKILKKAIEMQEWLDSVEKGNIVVDLAKKISHKEKNNEEKQKTDKRSNNRNKN